MSSKYINIENLAIIPARGGSKSIPKKNLIMLNNKPLIEYTLEVALKSKNINKVLVTSDDEEILKLSKCYKEVIVVKRPSQLSKDDATTELCLIHALDEIEKKYSYRAKNIFVLEPTSPLRTVETINNAVHIFSKSNYESLISLVETKECLGKINQKNFTHLDKDQPRRRQERNSIYKECGTIYGTKKSIIEKYKSIFGKTVYPLIVPKIESFDINDFEDLKIVEYVMKGQ